MALKDLPIVWKVHPLKDNKNKSILLILFLIFIIYLVQFSSHEWIFTILAIIMLTLALMKYIFPTEYRLSQEGIQIQFLGRTTSRKWSEFQSYYTCPNGIQLSTFPQANRLDSFSGYFLITRENREDILSFLRIKLSESK